MKAMRLTERELDNALSVVPAHFAQAKRLVEHLAKNPNSLTSTVASTCSIGNISDVARKTNPTLFKERLFISCKRPVIPVCNQFGERSNMFMWGIYKLPDEPQNGLEVQNMNEIK